jgi:hypothetical protein
MNNWIPFKPIYRRPWWQRLMFWRKHRYPVAIYKQVGRIVHININPTRNKTNDGGTTFTMPVGELPDLRNPAPTPNKDKESK